MIESVSICYSQLHANKQHITKLDAWITEMRNTLKERAVQKQEMEQVNANIYSYMHDMLGPQIMEIFDAEQRNL